MLYLKENLSEEDTKIDERVKPGFKVLEKLKDGQKAYWQMPNSKGIIEMPKSKIGV